MKTFKKSLLICVALCLSADWVSFAMMEGTFYMKTITLTRGKVTIVDDEDYDFLMQWKWQAHPNHGRWYAYTSTPMVNGKRGLLIMHRLLMNAKKGQFVDHKDRDGLNNQKSNLRFCTIAENNRNREKPKNSASKYTGVSKRIVRKNYGKGEYHYWMSRIYINGKRIVIGIFKDEKVAAAAYNNAAIIHYGEFAKLNIIE